MSGIPTEPELGPTEAALAALRPALGPIDRDRLMFEAGAASARAESSSRRAWQAIAAALALVAGAETLALATRPERLVVVREPATPREEVASKPPVEILARSPAPVAADEAPWTGGGEAITLRRQILRHGLDGLPELPPLLSLSGPASVEQPPAPLRGYDLIRMLDPGGPS
jgi:hypothetical protein